MQAVIVPADSSSPATVVDAQLTLDYLQGVVGGGRRGARPAGAGSAAL